jgi:predicted GIY-YIG superfamily endonuclease
MQVVYKIENIIDGKFYIGSTINYKRRCKGHIYKLNKNKHKNPRLQNAWNKYGKDNFKISIIEEVETNILEREQFYIDLYKPYDRLIGYNILKDVGFTWLDSNHSKKTINKIRKSKIGNKNPMYGKGKSIDQLDKDGNYIRTFISVPEAAKYLNLKTKIVKKKNRANRKIYITHDIRNCLNNKTMFAHGFKWVYSINDK